MRDYFQLIADVSVVVFIVTSMLSIGLRLTPRDILSPLASPRLVVFALVANFALAPALAWGLTQFIPLHPSYATGLLLLGGAAGAPFLPKLAEFAKGDLGYSVALMILLTVGSVAFLPLVLPHMVPGLKADAWMIARPLIILMLIPILVGLALQYIFKNAAGLLISISEKLNQWSLLLLILLLIGLNMKAIGATVGSGAILAALLFVSLSLGAGYALGGPDPRKKKVLALGTGQRNVAAALAIATSSFSDTRVVTMVLVATLFGLIPLGLAGRYLGRMS